MRQHQTTRTVASRRRGRGFTLIEVMTAMVVCLIATIGAVAGLLSASRDLREGQMFLYAHVLADATANRLWAMGGPAGTTATSSQPPVYALDQSVGGGAEDLSTGAFFTVQPNGTITKLPTPAGATDCTALGLGVVPNLYCREVVSTPGDPANSVPGAGALLVGATPTTVWIRVSRVPVPGKWTPAPVLTQEVFIR